MENIRLIARAPLITVTDRRRSGSVIECLTRDRGAAGSSPPASLRRVLEQEH